MSYCQAINAGSYFLIFFLFFFCIWRSLNELFSLLFGWWSIWQKKVDKPSNFDYSHQGSQTIAAEARINVSIVCIGFVFVLFLLIYIFRNEIAEIISFAIFLKFILLMILVASFQTSDGKGWRSEMITEWRQIAQPMLLGSVAIGGITQVH